MLTKERVKAAYDASGLNPTISDFTKIRDDGAKCACAISATLIGEGHITFEILHNALSGVEHESDLDFDSLVSEHLGMDSEQFWDFAIGFDKGYIPIPTPAYFTGLETHEYIFGSKE